MMLSFTFASHTFELHPDRALWWSARQTLLIADLHVGKAATFRARGMPVPEGTTRSDLHRLDGVIEQLRPQRLLLLGDLFHARESIDDRAIAPLLEWRARHRRLEVVLIRGNHDRHAGPTPRSLQLEVRDEALLEDGLEFAHEPRPLEDAGSAEPGKADGRRNDALLPRLCGHLHPVATLRDFDGSRVRLPCAVVDPLQLILPAFSRFTGGLGVPAAPGRRRYTFAAGRVVLAPDAAR